MKYYKEITLKNGESCVLRSAVAEDAVAVLQSMKKTSDETTYMVRYSDEIKLSVEDEKAFLENMENSLREALFVAETGGNIVCSAGFRPVSPYERLSHRCGFGISVLKEYWGLGIGTQMIAAITEAARTAGYEQVELGVVEENIRAYSLYEKAGFRCYGKLEKAFRYRDGSYANEKLMVLYL